MTQYTSSFSGPKRIALFLLFSDGINVTQNWGWEFYVDEYNSNGVAQPLRSATHTLLTRFNRCCRFFSRSSQSNTNSLSTVTDNSVIYLGRPVRVSNNVLHTRETHEQTHVLYHWSRHSKCKGQVLTILWKWYEGITLQRAATCHRANTCMQEETHVYIIESQGYIVA